jgi:fumarylacetoacetase
MKTIQSWIPIPANSDFSPENLPFGIFSTSNKSARAGVAIGEHIIDLSELHLAGLINQVPLEVLNAATLNTLIACGKKNTSALRLRVQELISQGNSELQAHPSLQNILVKQSDATMHMPVHVGDYTDFYSSIDHATNMGKMFRDPENALLPNWKHIPVGYHGRASSIRVSGFKFHRPMGQLKPADTEVPVFAPSKLMDFELETAFIIGKNSNLGERISTEQADDYIFGMVLFNDWSARDIQSWEYVPLGPFLAKNFASVVSPWIVTLDALERFRVEGYKQEPKVQPYLEYSGNKNVDINLEVSIKPEHGEETIVSRSNYKYMYWTMEQQLAHHTVNGCNMNVGDMLASGTISGPDEGSYGSMMEITWRGTKPVKMRDGSERKFINDGDSVIIRGYCEKNGVRVGFGECSSTLLPAIAF